MKFDKHICIITYGYPHEKMPYYYTFVDELVCAVADQNVKCTVINPVGIGFKSMKNQPPVKWERKTRKGNAIEVFCPRYLYFYAKKVFNTNTGLLTYYFFKKAVIAAIKKYGIKPDILYAHFIFPAGVSATAVGNDLKLPVFLTYGESTPWGIKVLGEKNVKKYLQGVNGIVAVSTAKKNEIISFELVSEEQITVFPNGVDNDLFYPRNKIEMRAKYGFSNKDFIIAYTGNYNVSKGVMRLVAAAQTIQNIKLVLIGGGKLKPESDNIIFKGFLPHDEVPLMLSACDIFVLPTLNEGCSNAIIEAMACGLPIVSSDRPFNDDILNSGNAILINPEIVEEIRSAILMLVESESLRKKLSQNSLLKAKQLSIDNRAESILKWMNSFS